jgi:G:T-mismatch repair DNA endonuclease (very short patch repair protein)
MGRPTAVSQRMSRARTTNTQPELAVRSAFHRRGLRFRVEPPLEFDYRAPAQTVADKIAALRSLRQNHG